jgi:hypothetical protein
MVDNKRIGFDLTTTYPFSKSSLFISGHLYTQITQEQPEERQS